LLVWSRSIDCSSPPGERHLGGLTAERRSLGSGMATAFDQAEGLNPLASEFKPLVTEAPEPRQVPRGPAFASPPMNGDSRSVSGSSASYQALGARIREAQSDAARRTKSNKGAVTGPWGGPTFQRPAPKSRPAWTPGAQGGSGLRPDQFLGNWADSLGNAVVVFSMCAYQVRLMATLSQPPRPDINLKISQLPDGGWLCGNATLDPAWSTETQMHWLTADGRISVWVRPQLSDSGSPKGQESRPS